MRLCWFGFEGKTAFKRENAVARRALPLLGFEVEWHDRSSPINEAGPADVGIINTLYSEGTLRGLDQAHARFTVLGGKDVLNYTRLGVRALNYLARVPLDFLAMPYWPPEFEETWSGPQLLQWPIALAPEFCRPLAIEQDRHGLPRILLWADNPCWERKGQDLNREVLLRLQRQGLEFEVIVKSQDTQRALGYFSEISRLRVVPNWRDQENLTDLFDSSDILLHLHRGGGQEMVPMEAISRGVIPILPNAGCSTMYADEDNARLIPAHEWYPAPEWVASTTGSLDSGHGYEADVDLATEAAAQTIIGIKTHKRKAASLAVHFQKKWAVERVLRDSLERVLKATGLSAT